MFHPLIISAQILNTSQNHRIETVHREDSLQRLPQRPRISTCALQGDNREILFHFQDRLLDQFGMLFNDNVTERAQATGINLMVGQDGSQFKKARRCAVPVERDVFFQRLCLLRELPIFVIPDTDGSIRLRIRRTLKSQQIAVAQPADKE